MAGLVVGIVALPLSMALAIASGVPPQHGLYTAIVAGGLIAAFGGSRTQVSGPTAAFVVVLTPISAKFGIGGLLVATLMAGLILMALGLAHLGKLIQYIPHPVTTGFTAGIAVVIATLQLKDLLGLRIAAMPEHFLERVYALAAALPTVRVAEFSIGLLTLAILIIWPKITKRVPAPLVALTIASLSCIVLSRLIPDFEVATIGSRFSYIEDGITHAGIPRTPPLPVLPWTLPGAGGQPFVLSFDTLRQLLPAGFAIAMLGAIESLLSAVVADGMARTKSDPDAELIAQGIGNVVSPFFGGFAATGAIARTATNIRSGGRSPVASIVHALFILGAVILLAPIVSYLPMTSLAALLLIVAWNMSEVKHFVHVLKVAPKSDVAVQLTCFSLTVVFDMVVSVTAGVVLAALLFMRRMAEITGVRLAEGAHPELREPLPPGVILYQIAGPLFFGAAQKAMSALETISGQARTVILHIEAVPAMDATGLVNLESAIERLHHEKTFVILAGVQPQPAKLLEKAGITFEEDRLAICATLEAAVAYARRREALHPPTSSHQSQPQSH
jgi:SulP family sulfate permease